MIGNVATVLRRCCVRLVAVGDARVIAAAIVVVVVVVAWTLNMVGSIVVARPTDGASRCVCRDWFGMDWRQKSRYL